MSEPVDFEYERALRQGSWTSWAEMVPPADLIIRLRGEVTMTGGGSPEEGTKFVRRGRALCIVPLDGGGMQLVQPPYQHLEWMPG